MLFRSRQRSLRLAQFFAQWGSTPGPTLVAGLNAYRNNVEGFITDQKEFKKFKRELDKSIADIDQADRLEKMGDVDAAMKIKMDARNKVEKLNEKVFDYKREQERAASEERRTQTTADATRYSADRHFEATRLSTLAINAQRAATEAGIRDSQIGRAHV